jgi:hypothetical protein
MKGPKQRGKRPPPAPQGEPPPPPGGRALQRLRQMEKARGLPESVPGGLPPEDQPEEDRDQPTDDCPPRP